MYMVELIDLDMEASFGVLSRPYKMDFTSILVAFCVLDVHKRSNSAYLETPYLTWIKIRWTFAYTKTNNSFNRWTL